MMHILLLTSKLLLFAIIHTIVNANPGPNNYAKSAHQTHVQNAPRQVTTPQVNVHSQGLRQHVVIPQIIQSQTSQKLHSVHVANKPTEDNSVNFKQRVITTPHTTEQFIPKHRYLLKMLFGCQSKSFKKRRHSNPLFRRDKMML